MVSKFEDIQRAADFGLNTESSRLVRSLTDINNLPVLPKYSIRANGCVYGQPSPHHPVVPRKDLGPVINEMLSVGFEPIVAECVDPADCLAAGVYTPDAIEVVRGPGTVRRITHDGKVDERYLNWRQIPDEKIRELCRVYDSIGAKLAEFSVYSGPVGRLGHCEITWELILDERVDNRRNI